jgi:hypothetical protein
LHQSHQSHQGRDLAGEMGPDHIEQGDWSFAWLVRRGIALFLALGIWVWLEESRKVD